MTTINNLTKHDSREFKVGDLVVSTWGLEKRVLKIVLKPKFKNGILYLTLLIDGYKRECLAQWWRPATPEEKEAGHRIDDTTDHVTDIRNHLSPSTLVWDLAGGEDWTAEAERHG